MGKKGKKGKPKVVDINTERIPPIRSHTMDLTMLTDEEERGINGVLEKDAVFQSVVDGKIGNIRSEVLEIRKAGALYPWDKKPHKICARCKYKFWSILCPFGDQGRCCVNCKFKVCKKCRFLQQNRTWICSLCLKMRQQSHLTGQWLGQAGGSGLYGSDLLRASMRDRGILTVLPTSMVIQSGGEDNPGLQPSTPQSETERSRKAKAPSSNAGSSSLEVPITHRKVRPRGVDTDCSSDAASSISSTSGDYGDQQHNDEPRSELNVLPCAVARSLQDATDSFESNPKYKLDNKSPTGSRSDLEVFRQRVHKPRESSPARSTCAYTEVGDVSDTNLSEYANVAKTRRRSFQLDSQVVPHWHLAVCQQTESETREIKTSYGEKVEYHQDLESLKSKSTLTPSVSPVLFQKMDMNAQRGKTKQLAAGGNLLSISPDTSSSSAESVSNYFLEAKNLKAQESNDEVDGSCKKKRRKLPEVRQESSEENEKQAAARKPEPGQHRQLPSKPTEQSSLVSLGGHRRQSYTQAQDRALVKPGNTQTQSTPGPLPEGDGTHTRNDDLLQAEMVSLSSRKSSNSRSTNSMAANSLHDDRVDTKSLRSDKASSPHTARKVAEGKHDKDKPGQHSKNTLSESVSSVPSMSEKSQPGSMHNESFEELYNQKVNSLVEMITSPNPKDKGQKHDIVPAKRGTLLALAQEASMGNDGQSGVPVTNKQHNTNTLEPVAVRDNDSGLPSSHTNTPEQRHPKPRAAPSERSGVPAISVTREEKYQEEEEEDEDIDDLFNHHRPGSTLGSRSSLADSRESIYSVYSDAGEVNYGRIPVSGDVQFQLRYNAKMSQLEVHVKQCRDLAPVDTKHQRSDPYVKTYLLPDKTRASKRKTKIKKHTLNPTFNEVLKYSISSTELESRTLWLTVWHNDRFGRNDFLGEVTMPLDYYAYDEDMPRWYQLQERLVSPDDNSLMTYKGDLLISLKFITPDMVEGGGAAKKKSGSSRRKGKDKERSKVGMGEVHVLVREAQNLTAMRGTTGASNPFCKGYLLPDESHSSKQKTQVLKKTVNPKWSHILVFDGLDQKQLSNHGIELTIWDYEKLSSNDFLGGVRLNLGEGHFHGKPVDWMDSRGEEIEVWRSMIAHPNEWVDAQLPLRPSMGNSSVKK